MVVLWLWLCFGYGCALVMFVLCALLLQQPHPLLMLGDPALVCVASLLIGEFSSFSPMGQVTLLRAGGQPLFGLIMLWRERDSNPRPMAYEAIELTELLYPATPTLAYCSLLRVG